MHPLSDHWNTLYRDTEDRQLGWHEDEPAIVLDLLARILDWRQARVFLPGAGTSVLVERLLDEGARLIVNDLSSVALDALKHRLRERGGLIKWNRQSIASPLLSLANEVDLWIDRAVLHFLMVADEIDGYFRNVFDSVRVGGHVLFAQFPPDGASVCAGLKLYRYSLDELKDRLGEDFGLIADIDHTYWSPVGDSRPYLYALFKRVAIHG